MTYAPIHIVAHWLTTLALVLMIGTGLSYSFDLADGWAMTLHQIAGQALIALIAIRLGARVFVKPRAKPTDEPAWERRLASAVHLALYTVLIAYVATGYVSASALRDPALLLPLDRAFARSDMGEILLEVHFALKWALLGLVSVHILGAAKHALLDRHSLPSNMLPRTN